MKTCTKCHLIKDESDFYSKGGSRTGLRPSCKKCCNTVVYTDETRARSAAWQREWRRKNPDQNWARYLRGYGTTPEWYDAQFEKQGGKCGICVKPCATGKRLAIDHDHKCCPTLPLCGECNRGLLCRGCNVGIGNMQDDPDILRAAIKYLEANT